MARLEQTHFVIQLHYRFFVKYLWLFLPRWLAGSVGLTVLCVLYGGGIFVHFSVCIVFLWFSLGNPFARSENVGFFLTWEEEENDPVRKMFLILKNVTRCRKMPVIRYESKYLIIEQNTMRLEYDFICNFDERWYSIRNQSVWLHYCKFQVGIWKF